MIKLLTLPTSLIHFSSEGRENLLFDLGEPPVGTRSGESTFWLGGTASRDAITTEYLFFRLHHSKQSWPCPGKRTSTTFKNWKNRFDRLVTWPSTSRRTGAETPCNESRVRSPAWVTWWGRMRRRDVRCQTRQWSTTKKSGNWKWRNRSWRWSCGWLARRCTNTWSNWARRLLQHSILFTKVCTNTNSNLRDIYHKPRCARAKFLSHEEMPKIQNR